MTSLTERDLSRTQFKSMVIMVWHVVEEVCKDEAVQFWSKKSTIRCFGGKKVRTDGLKLEESKIKKMLFDDPLE